MVRLRRGRAEAPVPRSDVSFRLDQKTANFKAAMVSRQMQRSPLTEGKQKNQLAQTEFRFIKKVKIETFVSKANDRKWNPSCQTAASARTRTAFIGAAAARGGASFRRADAAQVCSKVGFVEDDGVFECSFANPARQIVSELQQLSWT